MSDSGGINIGRILGRGLDALGRNAPAVFGLAILLVGVPAFASQYWLMSQTMGGPLAVGSPGIWFLVMMLVSIFVPVVSDSVLLGFVAPIVLRQLGGRRAEAGRGIVTGLGMALPLLALSVLVGLIVALGLLLLIVPGVILYLVLIVAVPAMVVERRGVFQSMVRSEALTSGSKGMIFLVALLLSLFSWLLSFLVGMIGPTAIDMVGPGFLAASLTGAIAETIRSSVTAAIISSLYLELRVMKEGDASDILAGVFE